MLALVSSRFMLFRRKRKLFCRRGWRNASIATLTLWVLIFVWFFLFFVFVSTSPSFPFFRYSLRRASCVKFSLVFLGLHKGRASNSIYRMDLFPLSIFCCISFIIVIHWWMKYQWILIWYFVTSLLQHAVVLTSVKERKTMEDWDSVW